MDDTIRKYIDRALEVSHAAEHDLSADELAEIAREIGLSDADLARVDRAVEDGMTRGNNFLRQSMWDEAIRELDDVVALAPTNARAKVALAECYVERYAVGLVEEDRTIARALLQRAIDRDPNNQRPYELMNRLNGSPQSHALQVPPQGASRVAIIVALAAVMMLMVVGFGMFFKSNTDEMQGPVTVEVSEPTTLTQTSVVTPNNAFKVDFAEVEGLAFELRHAEHKHYSAKSFITIWGAIKVTGDVEVQELKGRITIFDASGKPVHTKDVTVLGSHQADLRRGDQTLFDFITGDAPTGTSAKLEITNVRSTPSSGGYAAPKPVEVSWAQQPPSHVSVKVFERDTSFTGSTLRHFIGTWEFHNTGSSALQLLSYNLHMLNAQGERTSTQKRYIMVTSRPPFLAGDVRIEKQTVKAAPDDVGYEIEILEYR